MAAKFGMSKKEPAKTFVMVSPYQAEPFSKGYDVKLPEGYGNRSYSKQINLVGKGMRNGKRS